MTKFTIGSYEIGSQTIYDALKQTGVSDDKTLKMLDTNGDMKISEDELVELLTEDEDENSKTTSSSGSGTTGQEAVSMLQMYDEMNLALETQLRSLYSDLASAKDIDETNDIMSSIDNVQSQIEQNRNAIYNLLVQSENQVAAASGTAAVANDGYTGLTTGTGIGGGTAFGNSVVSIAQSFVGKLKESDGSYLKVTGGRQEAWCADFVTYVVKQACAQTGKSLNGFGSPSVSSLQAWGQANNCYIDVAGSSNRAQTIVQNVKPGDVMIQKSNGASHTGIVTKVYSDGSFDTIEGNTSDQCLARHYDASSSKLSGFVKIT